MGIWNWIKENVVTIVASTAAAIVTGGSSLVIQAAAIGGTFVLGQAIDADRKQREAEKQKLALAGKAGEAITGQVNNLQNDRLRLVRESEDLLKELQRHKAKANDPNATPEEKELAKKMIPIIQSQLDEKSSQIGDYDKKINDLINSIPTGSEKNKGGLINLESMDQQTKLIVGAGIFLIVYLAFVKDSKEQT